MDLSEMGLGAPEISRTWNGWFPKWTTAIVWVRVITTSSGIGASERVSDGVSGEGMSGLG